MRSWFLNHELCGSYPRRILDRSVVFSQRDVKLSRSRLRGDRRWSPPSPFMDNFRVADDTLSGVASEHGPV